MSSEPVVRDAIVVLDGLQFHYRDWGDPGAPAVVLLHAYTQHARSWDTVARGPADTFRVLALDHRSFGESEWAADYHELRLVGDLGGFADALGLATFAAVGFSMSVGTAASYALLYPERVERLVLMEAFAEPDEQGDAPWIREMHDKLGRLAGLPASFGSVEEAMAAFRPLATYAEEDELHQWLAGALRQDAGGRWIWRLDPALRVPGPPERLKGDQDAINARIAKLTCPLLLLAGEESWLAEPMHRVAQLNPRARAVTVPRAGHWVPLDNPRGFLEIVRPFLLNE